MITLPYEIVDVFTDRPFTGNPLAVVYGAEQLGTDQMQALAGEFNLSETVFVLPPTQPDATYRARIFTPEEELPFGLHLGRELDCPNGSELLVGAIQVELAQADHGGLDGLGGSD